MAQDKLNSLKNVIRDTYECYLKDGMATVLDVTKFFNISLDTSRLEDYSVVTFNTDIPSIQIKDRKNNIFYHAAYTGDADLLRFHGEVQFNHIITTSPNQKEESLYYIGDDTPIITKMTFTNGDYCLSFEKKMPHSIGPIGNDGIEMVVQYCQNANYDGKNIPQPLLTKIYKNIYKDQKLDGTFEETYTYGANCSIPTHDKYTYIKDKHIIYGINNLKENVFYNYFDGICFENTNISQTDFFGTSMYKKYAKDYPLLNEDNLYSAIVFRCKTEDEIQHSLQIYKTENNTDVIYYAKKESYEGYYHTEIIVNDRFSLPNLSSGTILNEEIQSILLTLKQYGDNLFIQIILKELNIFGKKIDLIQEDIDPLSPKLLVGKSFDKISNSFYKNRDFYFNLIESQFEMAIGLNKGIHKNSSKK